MTQSDVDRLLGAHSVKEVEKILTELKLTSTIDQGISQGYAILNAIGSWMRGEVEQMCPASRQATFRILWLEGDAPLLAYLLKKNHNLNAETSREPLPAFTAYDPQTLESLVMEGIENGLPEHLCTFVREQKALQNPTPRDIETAVAQYISNLQLRLARTSGSHLVRTYVAHQIDLKNIRTALRLQNALPQETIPHLLEGGTISCQQLAQGTTEGITVAIGRSDLGMLFPANLESILTDPIDFERSAAHIIALDIARMWNVPLSIEPLFAFAAITLSQLTLLRTILIAKMNELSPQEIKRILPPFLTASNFAS